MKILCIGGCKDGKWVDIHGINPYMRYAVSINQAEPLYYKENDSFTTTMEVDTYHIEKIRTEKGKYQFLLHVGMTIDEMLVALMDNYRPEHF